MKRVAFAVFFIVALSWFHRALASDLFQADSYFQQEQYELARDAYIDAANVGSAHAFYQLGLMEYKGLGVVQNSVKALVWFSLAAEQKFNDSPSIVADLMALASAENKTELMHLTTSFLAQYGVQFTQRKYYPQLKVAELSKRILFVEEGELPERASPSYHYIDTLDIDLERERAWDAERMSDEGSSGPSQIFAREKMLSIREHAYSAVVDFDVAPDGSARNLESSQEIAYYRPALNQLKINRGPRPQFAGNNVAFVNQAKLGLAGYNRFKLSSGTYERFYYSVVRQAKKLRQAQSAVEQYRYGLLLMSFEWLAQNDNEIDEVFKSLSESGFPLAQYEYGSMLYRQQRELSQAIHWLSEASKYGNAKAQYRLARILTDSPWVEKDERKALFWFERAAQNGHKIARLKTAELKLLATDKELHNINSAQKDLIQVDSSFADNPEYEYLQAILYASFTPRQLPEAVAHLRRAIHLADNLNWDTIDWQNALNRWTSGGTVTIVEP